MQNFITNTELIKSLTKKLSQVESDGWETKYIDIKDNSEWRKIYLESEYQGGGYPILFKYPQPSQSELIDILLSRTNTNEISAIANFLKYYEYDDSNNLREFRSELIDKLEAITRSSDFKMSNFESKRLTTIIYDSELDQPYNQREILSKNHNQVNEDYLYYKNIADRAKRILVIINKK